MAIHLIAVGARMPAWVNAGVADYASRLSREWGLRLIEIATGRRHKNSVLARTLQDESVRLQAAIPAGALVIALDERGQQWDSQELAQRLAGWLQEGRDVALLVGGPDGLAVDCRRRADHIWSLSKLTLPHLLVRIVVAEQIYRAWSIRHHHPYHRA